jgi:hypothetical protein
VLHYTSINDSFLFFFWQVGRASSSVLHQQIYKIHVQHLLYVMNFIISLAECIFWLLQTRYAIDEDKKKKKSILTIVLVVAIAGLGLAAPLVAIVLYERSRGRQQGRHQHRGQAARKITVVRFHSDDEPAGDDCSICLDPYADRDRVGLLPCRHIFHAVCIRKWIVDGVSSTCPTCREVV